MTTEADRGNGADPANGAAQGLSTTQRTLWTRVLYLGLGTVSLRPALWDIARGNVERAKRRLAQISSANVALLKGATGAALRGARAAESRGQHVQACRFWLIYQLLTGDTHKALRNAERCARGITALKTDRTHILKALSAWHLVAAIDSRSPEAKQGIFWCYAGLGRSSEQNNDFTAARLHWAKAVELSPRNDEAVQGLRRSLGHVSPSENSPAVRTREDLEGLYSKLKKAAGRPTSNAAAGRLLLQAGAPEKAVEFLLAAWAQKRSRETALSLFSCLTALDRFEEAARLLKPLAAGGLMCAVHRSELQAVLENTPPSLGRNVARIVATTDGAEGFAPLILPFLLSANDTASVLRIARGRVPEGAGWSNELILETAAFLERAGEGLCALRLLALFSELQTVGEIFAARMTAYGPRALEEALLAPDDPEFESLCLAYAEYFLGQGLPARTIELLRRLADGGGYPSASRRKERASGLVAQLLTETERAAELAELVTSWLPKSVRELFRGPSFETLLATLSAGSRFRNAPEASRLGVLREGYFEHHLERRENQLPDGFPTELGFGEAAIRYFEAMTRFRSAEIAPVSAALRARLSQSWLSFGEGHSADLLMSCALLRGTTRTDLRVENLYEEIGRWFLDSFMHAHGIPSELLGDGLLAQFNSQAVGHSNFGVIVTRFSRLLWEGSPEYRSRYDLEIPLDAVLFSLEVLAVFLPTCLHYRKPLASMLAPADGGRGTFMDACIAALSGLPEKAEPFTDVLSYRVPFRHSATARIGQPQDVLLIGHGGEGTGLSRNMRMLKSALDSGGFALTTLAFELQPAPFAEALNAWRSKCKTTPVVVAAVNAHDLPSVFIRDRHEVLEDCQVAGFFLWESSKAPRVQHLGIRLVDEVWAPTRYVANIYAPFVPVYVVGKGLFSNADWPASIDHRKTGPSRFLTVFDFHSSIERKNPLAVVLAFQKAFAGGEKVELVVKASNVNPQHPGNASGQWERLCAASARDRRIRIVTERYSERQMRELMRDTDCMVSLHRSEGFGYVLADALAIGIPVIGTDYSGSVDFCDEQTSFPVSYKLMPTQAHGALWEDEETQWAEPDVEAAAAQMRRVYQDYPEALRKAALGRDRLRARYSAEVFAATLRQRIAAMAGTAGIDPAAEVN